MARIGVYPAAFDPIHVGHIAFATAAMQQAQLDRVYFLPEPRPRHRQGVKSYEHRLNMVKHAVHDMPQFATVVLEHVQFTPQDLWPRLLTRFPETSIYMLFGSDTTRRLAHWHIDTQVLGGKPQFLVADRMDRGNVTETLAGFRAIGAEQATVAVIPTMENIRTSQAIRHDLKRGNRPSDVPEPVLRYIAAHGLYTSGAV